MVNKVSGNPYNSGKGEKGGYLTKNVDVLCNSDVWLAVHRNSVWIKKTN